MADVDTSGNGAQLDCSVDSGICVDVMAEDLKKKLQEFKRILFILERDKEARRLLRERLSRIAERKIIKKKKNEQFCSVCFTPIDTEDSKTCIACCSCDEYVCRGGKKCSELVPKDGEWRCRLCTSKTESYGKTSTWVEEQYTVKRATPAYAYPMRARSEIYIPLCDPNDSAFLCNFESVSEAPSTINVNQKQQIREYIEEVLAEMLGGSLDSTSVGPVSRSENYIPIGNEHELQGISHVRLRRLIESIIAETVRLPAFLQQSDTTPAADQQSEPLTYNGNQCNGDAQHYFEPKRYQDLLATAVLNKIVDSHGNERHSESSPDLTSSAFDKNHNALFPNKTTDDSISSSSSIEPRSESSLTDPLHNINKRDENVSPIGSYGNFYADVANENIEVDRESVLSDFIASHMVPLPHISADPASEEDDEEDEDFISVTSSSRDNWEDNWLFKKKRSGKITSSIGMLVPAPKENIRALIGDKPTDEVSDLSEVGSDTDDSSLEMVSATLEPLNDRLVNKHLIGGKNTKVVLDELVEQSSMISTSSLPENARPYTDTKNEFVVSNDGFSVDESSKMSLSNCNMIVSNEAINSNVSRPFTNNDSAQTEMSAKGPEILEEEESIVPPPSDFTDDEKMRNLMAKFHEEQNNKVDSGDENSSSLSPHSSISCALSAAIDRAQLSDYEGITDFSVEGEENLAEETEFLFGESSSSRRPSVIEILAAIALGPMLAVSASDDRNMLTELEVSSLMELNELAMAELNAKNAEERNTRLGMIAEESSFDSGNGDEERSSAFRDEPDLLTSPNMVMKAIRDLVRPNSNKSSVVIEEFQYDDDIEGETVTEIDFVNGKDEESNYTDVAESDQGVPSKNQTCESKGAEFEETAQDETNKDLPTNQELRYTTQVTVDIAHKEALEIQTQESQPETLLVEEVEGYAQCEDQDDNTLETGNAELNADSTSCVSEFKALGTDDNIMFVPQVEPATTFDIQKVSKEDNPTQEIHDPSELNSAECTAITDGGPSSSISNESLHTIGDSSEYSDCQDGNSIDYNISIPNDISSAVLSQITGTADDFLLQPPMEFCDETIHKLAEADEVHEQNTHITDSNGDKKQITSEDIQIGEKADLGKLENGVNEDVLISNKDSPNKEHANTSTIRIQSAEESAKSISKEMTQPEISSRDTKDLANELGTTDKTSEPIATELEMHTETSSLDTQPNTQCNASAADVNTAEPFTATNVFEELTAEESDPPAAINPPGAGPEAVEAEDFSLEVSKTESLQVASVKATTVQLAVEPTATAASKIKAALEDPKAETQSEVLSGEALATLTATSVEQGVNPTEKKAYEAEDHSMAAPENLKVDETLQTTSNTASSEKSDPEIQSGESIIADSPEIPPLEAATIEAPPKPKAGETRDLLAAEPNTKEAGEREALSMQPAEIVKPNAHVDATPIKPAAETTTETMLVEQTVELKMTEVTEIEIPSLESPKPETTEIAAAISITLKTADAKDLSLEAAKTEIKEVDVEPTVDPETEETLVEIGTKQEAVEEDSLVIVLSAEVTAVEETSADSALGSNVIEVPLETSETSVIEEIPVKSEPETNVAIEGPTKTDSTQLKKSLCVEADTAEILDVIHVASTEDPQVKAAPTERVAEPTVVKAADLTVEVPATHSPKATVELAAEENIEEVPADNVPKPIKTVASETEVPLEEQPNAALKSTLVELEEQPAIEVNPIEPAADPNIGKPPVAQHVALTLTESEQPEDPSVERHKAETPDATDIEDTPVKPASIDNDAPVDLLAEQNVERVAELSEMEAKELQSPTENVEKSIQPESEPNLMEQIIDQESVVPMIIKEKQPEDQAVQETHVELVPEQINEVIAVEQVSEPKQAESSEPDIALIELPTVKKSEIYPDLATPAESSPKQKTDENPIDPAVDQNADLTPVLQAAESPVNETEQPEALSVKGQKTEVYDVAAVTETPVETASAGNDTLIAAEVEQNIEPLPVEQATESNEKNPLKAEEPDNAAVVATPVESEAQPETEAKQIEPAADPSPEVTPVAQPIPLTVIEAEQLELLSGKELKAEIPDARVLAIKVNKIPLGQAAEPNSLHEATNAVEPAIYPSAAIKPVAKPIVLQLPEAEQPASLSVDGINADAPNNTTVEETSVKRAPDPSVEAIPVEQAAQLKVTEASGLVVPFIEAADPDKQEISTVLAIPIEPAAYLENEAIPVEPETGTEVMTILENLKDEASDPPAVEETSAEPATDPRSTEASKLEVSLIEATEADTPGINAVIAIPDEPAANLETESKLVQPAQEACDKVICFVLATVVTEAEQPEALSVEKLKAETPGVTDYSAVEETPVEQAPALEIHETKAKLIEPAKEPRAEATCVVQATVVTEAEQPEALSVEKLKAETLGKTGSPTIEKTPVEQAPDPSMQAIPAEQAAEPKGPKALNLEVALIEAANADKPGITTVVAITDEPAAHRETEEKPLEPEPEPSAKVTSLGQVIKVTEAEHPKALSVEKLKAETHGANDSLAVDETPVEQVLAIEKHETEAKYVEPAQEPPAEATYVVRAKMVTEVEQTEALSGEKLKAETPETLNALAVEEILVKPASDPSLESITAEQAADPKVTEASGPEVPLIESINAGKPEISEAITIPDEIAARLETEAKPVEPVPGFEDSIEATNSNLLKPGIPASIEMPVISAEYPETEATYDIQATVVTEAEQPETLSEETTKGESTETPDALAVEETPSESAPDTNLESIPGEQAADPKASEALGHGVSLIKAINADKPKNFEAITIPDEIAARLEAKAKHVEPVPGFESSIEATNFNLLKPGIPASIEMLVVSAAYPETEAKPVEPAQELCVDATYDLQATVVTEAEQPETLSEETKKGESTETHYALAVEETPSESAPDTNLESIPGEQAADPKASEASGHEVPLIEAINVDKPKMFEAITIPDEIAARLEAKAKHVEPVPGFEGSIEATNSNLLKPGIPASIEMSVVSAAYPETEAKPVEPAQELCVDATYDLQATVVTEAEQPETLSEETKKGESTETHDALAVEETPSESAPDTNLESIPGEQAADPKASDASGHEVPLIEAINVDKPKMFEAITIPDEIAARLEAKAKHVEPVPGFEGSIEATNSNLLKPGIPASIEMPVVSAEYPETEATYDIQATVVTEAEQPETLSEETTKGESTETPNALAVEETPSESAPDTNLESIPDEQAADPKASEASGHEVPLIEAINVDKPKMFEAITIPDEIAARLEAKAKHVEPVPGFEGSIEATNSNLLKPGIPASIEMSVVSAAYTETEAKPVEPAQELCVDATYDLQATVVTEAEQPETLSEETKKGESTETPNALAVEETPSESAPDTNLESIPGEQAADPKATEASGPEVPLIEAINADKPEMSEAITIPDEIATRLETEAKPVEPAQELCVDATYDIQATVVTEAEQPEALSEDTTKGETTETPDALAVEETPSESAPDPSLESIPVKQAAGPEVPLIETISTDKTKFSSVVTIPFEPAAHLEIEAKPIKPIPEPSAEVKPLGQAKGIIEAEQPKAISVEGLTASCRISADKPEVVTIPEEIATHLETEAKPVEPLPGFGDSIEATNSNQLKTLETQANRVEQVPEQSAEFMPLGQAIAEPPKAITEEVEDLSVEKLNVKIKTHAESEADPTLESKPVEQAAKLKATEASGSNVPLTEAISADKLEMSAVITISDEPSAQLETETKPAEQVLAEPSPDPSVEAKLVKQATEPKATEASGFEISITDVTNADQLKPGTPAVVEMPVQSAAHLETEAKPVEPAQEACAAVTSVVQAPLEIETEQPKAISVEKYKAETTDTPAVEETPVEPAPDPSMEAIPVAQAAEPKGSEASEVDVALVEATNADKPGITAVILLVESVAHPETKAKLAEPAQEACAEVTSVVKATVETELEKFEALSVENLKLIPAVEQTPSELAPDASLQAIAAKQAAEPKVTETSEFEVPSVDATNANKPDISGIKATPVESAAYPETKASPVEPVPKPSGETTPYVQPTVVTDVDHHEVISVEGLKAETAGAISVEETDVEPAPDSSVEAIPVEQSAQQKGNTSAVKGTPVEPAAVTNADVMPVRHVTEPKAIDNSEIEAVIKDQPIAETLKEFSVGRTSVESVLESKNETAPGPAASESAATQTSEATIHFGIKNPEVPKVNVVAESAAEILSEAAPVERGADAEDHATAAEAIEPADEPGFKHSEIERAADPNADATANATVADTTIREDLEALAEVKPADSATVSVTETTFVEIVAEPKAIAEEEIGDLSLGKPKTEKEETYPEAEEAVIGPAEEPNKNVAPVATEALKPYALFADSPETDKSETHIAVESTVEQEDESKPTEFAAEPKATKEAVATTEFLKAALVDSEVKSESKPVEPVAEPIFDERLIDQASHSNTDATPVEIGTIDPKAPSLHSTKSETSETPAFEPTAIESAVKAEKADKEAAESKASEDLLVDATAAEATSIQQGSVSNSLQDEPAAQSNSNGTATADAKAIDTSGSNTFSEESQATETSETIADETKSADSAMPKAIEEKEVEDHSSKTLKIEIPAEAYPKADSSSVVKNSEPEVISVEVPKAETPKVVEIQSNAEGEVLPVEALKAEAAIVEVISVKTAAESEIEPSSIKKATDLTVVDAAEAKDLLTSTEAEQESETNLEVFNTATSEAEIIELETEALKQVTPVKLFVEPTATELAEGNSTAYSTEPEETKAPESEVQSAKSPKHKTPEVPADETRIVDPVAEEDDETVYKAAEETTKLSEEEDLSAEITKMQTLDSGAVETKTDYPAAGTAAGAISIEESADPSLQDALKPDVSLETSAPETPGAVDALSVESTEHDANLNATEATEGELILEEPQEAKTHGNASVEAVIVEPTAEADDQPATLSVESLCVETIVTPTLEEIAVATVTEASLSKEAETPTAIIADQIPKEAAELDPISIAHSVEAFIAGRTNVDVIAIASIEEAAAEPPANEASQPSDFTEDEKTSKVDLIKGTPIEQPVEPQAIEASKPENISVTVSKSEVTCIEHVEAGIESTSEPEDVTKLETLFEQDTVSIGTDESLLEVQSVDGPETLELTHVNQAEGKISESVKALSSETPEAPAIESLLVSENAEATANGESTTGETNEHDAVRATRTEPIIDPEAETAENCVVKEIFVMEEPIAQIPASHEFKPEHSEKSKVPEAVPKVAAQIPNTEKPTPHEAMESTVIEAGEPAPMEVPTTEASADVLEVTFQSYEAPDAVAKTTEETTSVYVFSEDISVSPVPAEQAADSYVVEVSIIDAAIVETSKAKKLEPSPAEKSSTEQAKPKEELVETNTVTAESAEIPNEPAPYGISKPETLLVGITEAQPGTTRTLGGKNSPSEHSLSESATTAEDVSNVLANEPQYSTKIPKKDTTRDSNFNITEHKATGVKIQTIHDFTSQVSEAITETLRESQTIPSVCSLSETCKIIAHPSLQFTESFTDTAQNPTDVYDEISHPNLEISCEKYVPCLADELRMAAAKTDTKGAERLSEVSDIFTVDQAPLTPTVNDSIQPNAQTTPQGNHISQTSSISTLNSFAANSQSSTTSLTTTSTRTRKTKYSGSQFRKLTLQDRRFLAELEKRRKQRELIQNYLDTLETIETPSYLTEDLYLESKSSIESCSPYSLFSQPPPDYCIVGATSTSRSAKTYFLNNILFSDRISYESNQTDDSTPTVIDTFDSSLKGSDPDTDSGEEFSRDEASNRDSTTDTATTITTKTLTTNNVTNQSHINSPPPPQSEIRTESACSALHVVETLTTGGNEEHVDDDLMKHLVPGSIAEREYKKWYNAVDMPNNPYSVEALKRRLSGGPEKFFDLPNISPSIEEMPVALGVDETKVVDDKNQERDYARYSRDYYINDAKHASGATKKHSSTATTPTAPIESPAPPSTSSSPTEFKNNSEDTIELQQMTPVKAMCRKLEKQCIAEIESEVYTATPARVEEYTSLDSTDIKDSIHVSAILPLTTDAVLKLSSETSSVPTAESLTPSEDSDTIRIYDLKKQETRIIKDNQHSNTTTTPLKKTRPTELDITPTVVPPTGCTSSKSSTPTSFKFLQPKRKLIDPSHVLSIDLDTNPISPTSTDKTVIEEEVVHALPSVRALAQAFLLTSSHDSPKPSWRKARAKSPNFLVTSTTAKATASPSPSPLMKPTATITQTPIPTIQKPPEPTVVDTSSHGSEDATIASDLSSLETDPPSKQEEIVPDTLALARQSSQERPLSPVLVPGCLRNNIAFFENLKNK